MKLIEIIKKMRVFITILILFFTLQSVVKADDIKEFEINGVSIGDNLLDFFSESEINNNKSYLYKNKKYAQFGKDLENSVYEGVFFEFKDNGKYIVESVIGKIFYNNIDFNECFKKEKNILNELKNLFENNSIYTNHGIQPHEGDPSGKSKGSWHTFELNDGSGYVYLECMNWTDEIKYYDNLRITILGGEFINYLATDAY